MYRQLCEVESIVSASQSIWAQSWLWAALVAREIWSSLSSCLPITWSHLHSVHESSNVYDRDSPTALGLFLSSALCRVLVLALEKKRKKEKKPWTNKLTTVACWRHNDSSYSALRGSLTLNTKRMMRGAHYQAQVYDITFIKKNDETTTESQKRLVRVYVCRWMEIVNVCRKLLLVLKNEALWNK